jgi:hypothetical protein
VTVLALFVLITLAWFLPLARHLNSAVLAGPSDATNVIRDYWAIDAQHSNPFQIRHDYLNGAPEGFPRPPAVQIAQPFQPAFVWAVKDVVGITAALNLFLLLGFVATAFATFLLLSSLELSFLPSLFGAYVVAFNPWMFERAFDGHVGLVHGWMFILVIAAALKLQREPTLRRAAVLGAAWGLSFSLSAYFGLLAALIVLVSYCLHLLSQREMAARLWTCTLACVSLGVVAVFLLPGAYAYWHDRTTVNRTLGNPVTELQTLRGASLASYLLPDDGHPIFGGITRRRLVGGSDERTVFFGLTTLVLAAAGMFLLRRRPRLFSDRQRAAMRLAAVLTPAAFIFSLPRLVDLGPVSVPTPGYFISQVTSFYRFYVRFGYIAGIGLAILAACVLHHMTRRRAALAAAALALVAFELLPGSISTWNAARPPAHDRWLASRPAGTVANYPLATDNQLALDLAQSEFYFQRFHGHPLYTAVGAGFGRTREEAIRILSRYVDAPLTPGVLAAEHVRYVLVHDDIYRQLGTTPPRVGSHYRYLATLGGVRAYELHAQPLNLDRLLANHAFEVAQVQGLRQPSAELGPGFHGPERDSKGREFRWLIQDGRLRVDTAHTDGSRFDVVAQAFSAHFPRRLQLVLDGRVLAETPVSVLQKTVTLGPVELPKGVLELELRAIPGPRPLGGGDPRVASIYLSPIVLPLADYSTSLREGP